MVCENIKSWNSTINQCDFGLDSKSFNSQLESAKSRALYIMTGDPCKAKTPGWGITQDELDSDVSGQLQIALQHLTTAEFLSANQNIFQKINSVGDYTSPTGERLILTSEDITKQMSLAKYYYNKAAEAASEFIKDCPIIGNDSGFGFAVRPFNWNIDACYPKGCNQC